MWVLWLATSDDFAHKSPYLQLLSVCAAFPRRLSLPHVCASSYWRSPPWHRHRVACPGQFCRGAPPGDLFGPYVSARYSYSFPGGSHVHRLYGLSLHQTYRYFKLYHSDVRLLKCVVCSSSQLRELASQVIYLRSSYSCPSSDGHVTHARH